MSNERNLTCLDDYKYRIDTSLTIENKIRSQTLSITIPPAFRPYVEKYGTIVHQEPCDLVVFDRTVRHPILAGDRGAMLAVARNLVVCIARCHLGHNWVEPQHVPTVKEGWSQELAEEAFVDNFFIFRFAVRSMNAAGDLHITSDSLTVCIDDIKHAYWTIYEFIPHTFTA